MLAYRIRRKTDPIYMEREYEEWMQRRLVKQRSSSLATGCLVLSFERRLLSPHAPLQIVCVHSRGINLLPDLSEEYLHFCWLPRLRITELG